MYTKQKSIVEKTIVHSMAETVTLAVAATLANDGDTCTVSVYAIGRDQAYPDEEVIRECRMTFYRYSGAVSSTPLYNDTSGYNNYTAVSGLALAANGDDIELQGSVNAAATVDWVATVKAERFS